jgi:hypothetical protein
MQRRYFERDATTERRWLEYTARLKGMSNWVKYAGFPFGDRVSTDEDGKQSHDLNLGDRGRDSFHSSERRHKKWKQKREESSGYADVCHSFRHQGSADLNLYKLFLEQAHSILADGGRLGFVVPSGLYSDVGTGSLRRLFIGNCRWEWLFGFENRAGIFDIHRSFKFNLVIIAKGGQTDTIRTAFMRRDLADWERGEALATLYPREQVIRFSPVSLAILELTTQKDLDLHSQMYATSTPIGGKDACIPVRYFNDEFHITKDSRLFPPLPKWINEGFQMTEEGVWRRGSDVAVPLYEGRMIDSFDFSAKAWISGKGRTAVWDEVPWQNKRFGPQYLMSQPDSCKSKYVDLKRPVIVYKKVTSSTNRRTLYATISTRIPSCDSAPVLMPLANRLRNCLRLCAVLNSLACDYTFRRRMSGVTVTWQYMSETPCPKRIDDSLTMFVARLALAHAHFAPEWLMLCAGQPLQSWKAKWACTEHERRRLRAIVDAVVAASYNLSAGDLLWILDECDWPKVWLRSNLSSRGRNPKGFWRVDNDLDPEHRHTVLSLVAFRDLQKQIDTCGGDEAEGIKAFCSQNDGDGWMLPETLRLADYGLGHDDRAKEYQPVRECFGPRFYDWQLAQTSEESWKECHLHARSLLGAAGYERLLAEIEGKPAPDAGPAAAPNTIDHRSGTLFDTDDAPLFQKSVRKEK